MWTDQSQEKKEERLRWGWIIGVSLGFL